MLQKQSTLIIAALLSSHLTMCAAEVSIGGTLEELDTSLKANNLQQLPEGTLEHKGNYYFMVQKKLSWTDAKTWCEERGGHLATISNAEENKICYELVRKVPKQQNFTLYFIGGTDSEQEGSWQWVTGEPFEFKQWGAQQPDNSGGSENYLSIHQYDGKIKLWNDAPNQVRFAAGFIIEWESSAFQKKSPLANAPADFPSSMVAMHKVMQGKILEAQDDLTALHPLIKNYGKKIVAAEKQATKAKKTAEAKALRTVRDNLVSLLKKDTPEETTQPSTPDTASPKLSSLAMVSSGKVQKQAAAEKKAWRLKSGALTSTKPGAKISLPNKIIGNGDFTVTALLKLANVGNTGPTFWIGGTAFKVDHKETCVWLAEGAFYHIPHKGKRTGGVLLADTWAECTIGREGNEAFISINGEEFIRKPIHEQELGLFSFVSGQSTVSIKDMTVSASLLPLEYAPVTTMVFERHGRHYHGSTVIPYSSKSRLLLNIGSGHGKLYGQNILWALRSKDNAESWEKPNVWFAKKQGTDAITTIAVATGKKQPLHLLHTTGSANQKVFYSQKAITSSAAIKPKDITASAKEAGMDIHFPDNGIFTQHHKDRAYNGKIIAPIVVGTETEQLQLISSSDNGKSWQRSESLMEAPSGSACITELKDGTLLLATGNPHTSPKANEIRIRTSKNGGATWSEETASTIPCQRFFGTLIATTNSAGKEVLVLANSLENPGGWRRSHLDIFTSLDRGKSWQRLRRATFGPTGKPRLTEIAPGTLALTYTAGNWATEYMEVKIP